MVKRAWSIAAVALSFCVIQAAALACPFCTQALFSPGDSAAQSGAARGYLLSIATLIGTPLILVGGITWLVVRAAHRAKH